jgi:hypothetical protein
MLQINMNKLLLTILNILFFISALLTAQGQYINNNLRTLDNNRAIAADSTEKHLYRNIKEIPVSRKKNSSKLSFGGEVREQLRSFNPINWGDVPEGQNENDTYLNQRYMLHADLRLNSTFRIFTQLNSNLTLGKDVVTGIDRDELGIMQGFLEINFKPAHMSFRAGRQELSYGAERMISTRDGPNVRQHFDGLRSTIHIKNTTGDFIVFHPVTNNIGVFDNTTNRDNLIYGTYWTTVLKNYNILDLYYLRNDLKEMRVYTDTVNESRNSFGARLSKSSGSFFYDLETTWQIGTYDKYNLSAFHITTILGYRWNGPMSPRIQIRGAIYSGNKDSTGQEFNYFRPVSAKPPVTVMAPIGPANIILFAPEGEIRVMKKVGLVFRYFAVWRYSKNDGLYNSRMDRMVREADKPGDIKGTFITSGGNFQIDYYANRHLLISLSPGYFAAEEYIQNTGVGEDNKVLFATVWYRF